MSREESSFEPTASLEALQYRSQLLRKIRGFFEAQQFLEVETPLISRDTVVDRYIEPVRVPQSNVLEGRASNARDLFLQTSPEFGMKRLLASGATAIFQICKAFRKGEAGRRHNPEFTMLEWYRVGDDYFAGIKLLADFAKRILEVEQVTQVTYRDAFLRYSSVDPFESSVDQLQFVCESNGIDVSSFVEDQDRDSWLNLIMSELVEPQLGISCPAIVYDWPASQAALAKVRCEDFEYAERFELYVNGFELANGYHELLDADELLHRSEKVNCQRQEDGHKPLPTQSGLLKAMRHGLPACSGVALGVDRLMMLLCDATSIGEVIAFPFDRA